MVMMGMGMGGGGMGMGDMPVPEVVREKHAKFWWALFALTLVSVVVELLAIDVFGVLFAALMSFIVWYLVKNQCRNMNQYCLFIFGIMCLIEALFELLTLATEVGGRESSTTTESTSTDSDGNTVYYYTTTVDVTPFFDSSQGVTYNAEAVGLIISPAVMVIGAVLCYYSYNAYDTSLWGDDLEDGRMDDWNTRRAGGGGGGGRVAGFSGRREDVQPRPAGRQTPQRQLFEGQGQRLGD